MNTEALTVLSTEQKSRPYLLVLGGSLLLAFIASQLLQGNRLGLDFLIFSLLCIGSVIGIRKVCEQPVTRLEQGLMLVGGVLCVLLVIRHSLVLYWLNLIGILTVLSMAFAKRYTQDLTSIPVANWLKTPFSFISLLCLSIVKLLSFGYALSFSGLRDQWHLRSIALGLLWASPILLILGSLLVSADTRFEMFATDLFDIDLSNVFETLVDYLIYWPLTAAFLYASILGKDIEVKPDNPEESSFRIEGVQLITVMVSIIILFLIYIMIQFSYFFGGAQLVIASDGLTYADYAKSGFWELIWVAMITVSLLLIGQWLLRNEDKNFSLWFNRLAAVMIAAVLIMEASAVHRMSLYIKMYGLTELRFYSSAFMVFVVCGLVSFYLTVLKGARGRYVSMMAAQAIVLIMMLNVLNPDAWIAESNLKGESTSQLDKNYIARLSADAVPTIYAASTTMSVAEACEIKQKIKADLSGNNQWFQWNWSLNRAHKIMDAWDHQCR